MSQFRKQLLVEGNDDRHVMLALCKQFNIPKNFEIIDCNGIDNLLMQIPVRLKQSDVKSLGIIVDADTHIKQRWNDLQSIFSKQGINFPKDIPKGGLVYHANDITIGIWIMPNNSLNGTLEDFISFLVPQGDKLWTVAKQVVDEIETKQLNRYIPTHQSKALIHSWLSWQEDPGTPLGLAITKKFLTTQDMNCLKLMEWLVETFR